MSDTPKTPLPNPEDWDEETISRHEETLDAIDSGEIEYPLARLVQGWQEGVPGMKVGGKRRLPMPYTLG